MKPSTPFSTSKPPVRRGIASVRRVVLGPRVPILELRRRPARYLLPTGFLAAAAISLLASIFLPYWQLVLHAPQYPAGLRVEAYLNHMTGDVAEIDTLNHYIGMRPLGDAAKLERSLSVIAIGVIALLVLAAVYVHTRFAAYLSVPGLLFPGIFLVDLQLWLRHFGRNLDPRAPLSQAIKPFVPPVLGEGIVGQFSTVATVRSGFVLALIASLAIAVGLYFHWRAYRPLVAKTAPGAISKTAVFLCAMLLLASSPGRAETIRVSPGGEASSLAAALDAARDHDTIRLEGGVHSGPVVVTKSLTLEGRGWPVIEGGSSGTAVRITAPRVTLRGLRIRGGGASLEQEDSAVSVEAPQAVIEGNRIEDALFGIYLRKAHGASLRGNHIEGKDLPVARRGDAIRLWYSHDVAIENNEVERTRDVVVWYSERVRVRRNTVRDSRFGVHFMYCDDAEVVENRLLDNSVGSYLMYSRRVLLARNRISGSRGPSGYGVGLKDIDDAVLEKNLIVGNRAGVYVDNSPRSLDAATRLSGNWIADNDVGVEMQPGLRRNHFTANAFVDNAEQVALTGGGVLEGNFWAVDGRGNHWSDYAGYDADGDGIGDLPYRSERFFEQIADRHPALKLFASSPATATIDLAARAFPVIRPQRKLEDPRPLARPVLPRGVPCAPKPSRLPFGLAAFGLVALAAVAFRSPGAPKAARGAVEASKVTGPMLHMESVTRRFGRLVAVDGLDLEVRPGEAVALWGANGAGKTTAIRCLLGLIPCEGRIEVGGRDLARAPKECRRRIGFVPQEIHFHEDLTVLETIDFYARLRGTSAAAEREAIGRAGLDEHLGCRVRELSGGRRRLLALAVALLGDPPLLVLDEPLSNLDVAARERFLRLLLDLKAAGKTLVFTSHRPHEVLRLADRVIVLAAGRKVAEGAPREVAARLGRSLLHVELPHEEIAAALALLAAAGFASRPNGRGIHVSLFPSDKARAVAALLHGGITVEDFDLEWDPAS